MGLGLGLRRIPVALHAFVLWGETVPSRTAVRGVFFLTVFPCPCHPSCFAGPLSVAHSFPMRTARAAHLTSFRRRPANNLRYPLAKTVPFRKSSPMRMWSRGTADTLVTRKPAPGMRAKGWAGSFLRGGYVIGLGNWGRSPMGEIRGEVMPTPDGTPPDLLLCLAPASAGTHSGAGRTSAVAVL